MYNLSSEKLMELVELGESEAWANSYLIAPEKFVNEYRLQVKRFGSVIVTMVPVLDWGFFNRIVGFGVGSAATESMLEDAIAVMEKAGCKNYMAQVSPLAMPSQLPEWLAKHGLIKSRNWAKMIRGDEPAPTIATDLRVESIGKEQEKDFVDIALEVFEMPDELRPLIGGTIGKPGWHHYLAYDVDQPVCAAAMNVSGETCWLGYGSTLESHRKRGGQGAMFARRIQDGLTLGCKWFVTETGEDSPENPNPSYHNMLRSGFKLAYLRPNYVHQTSES